MRQVFNMGIGMVIVVSQKTKEKVCKVLQENNESYYQIGEIVRGETGVLYKSSR